MGLSDRDYARDAEGGLRLAAPQTAVGLLIALNVGLFVIDLLLDGKLSNGLELSADVAQKPWNAWQLISYGFVHDSRRIWHILGNMLCLWVFGGDIERMYGRNEFLRLYVLSIIVGGAVWVAAQNLLHHHPAAAVVGASGAVSCIWVLYALNFPNRMVLLGGFLPIPVWFLGFFMIVSDLTGFIASLGGAASNTAFEAHLAGALLALVYRRFDWNFGRWLPTSVTMTARGPLHASSRPKLKLHQPTTEDATDLESAVDRILAKISASGTDSLTDDERRTLERASARYQKRRS